MELDRLRSGTGHAQVLDIRTWCRLQFVPPFVRWRVQFFGADQIPDSTALVRLFHSLPELIELGLQQVGLILKHRPIRHQVKERSGCAANWRIELPAWKDRHSGGADCVFYSSFGTAQPFSRKARVDRA